MFPVQSHSALCSEIFPALLVYGRELRLLIEDSWGLKPGEKEGMISMLAN
jgi:hypothetical protein